MFNIAFEKPYTYVDPAGDKYFFHTFTDISGGRHFSIRVAYADSKKSIPIFGYEVLGHSFAVPLDGDTILWNYYDEKDGPRWRAMSEIARKIADKAFKLKAFL